MQSEVLKRGPARFDMVGRKLPYTLHDTDETISSGLLERLHRFGHSRLTEAGFEIGSGKWQCHVYTMDGDLPRLERYYTVEFTHVKGGMIGVHGIAIGAGGWPCLDHGLCIDAPRAAMAEGGNDA
ncbi:hypothetical protein C5748_18095 [Phyllobacterium phragmitis]|uniref:Uncharacterized protein n=1 Tax=Phyllobacterium phragmitis TaxID=2670329 RepID=A0A2S9ING2_9HYPH|nr:hypothetical protein [Phyllobacterium phragmitis]PRD42069.1 hypothetical protein C5748_18095 [Phyllobacterium phragmitis]